MAAYTDAVQTGTRLIEASNKSSSTHGGYTQSERWSNSLSRGWNNEWADGEIGQRIIWTSHGESFDQEYDIRNGVIRVNSVIELQFPKSIGSPDSRDRSDITYLDWKLLTMGGTRFIRRVEFSCITNKDMKEVVNQVFDNVKAKLQPLPGRTFTQSDGDAFKALLGMPEARVMGRLFAEHRQQLGWKFVESIQVYCGSNISDDKSHEIFVTLHIADVK